MRKLRRESAKNSETENTKSAKGERRKSAYVATKDSDLQSTVGPASNEGGPREGCDEEESKYITNENTCVVIEDGIGGNKCTGTTANTSKMDGSSGYDDEPPRYATLRIPNHTSESVGLYTTVTCEPHEVQPKQNNEDMEALLMRDIRIYLEDEPCPVSSSKEGEPNKENYQQWLDQTAKFLGEICVRAINGQSSSKNLNKGNGKSKRTFPRVNFALVNRLIPIDSSGSNCLSKYKLPIYFAVAVSLSVFVSSILAYLAYMN